MYLYVLNKNWSTLSNSKSFLYQEPPIPGRWGYYDTYEEWNLPGLILFRPQRVDVEIPSLLSWNLLIELRPGGYSGHRFSQKWQLRVCKWNFRVCKMPLLMKIPMKILGCAISSFARAKHRCTGGWLILWFRLWVIVLHVYINRIVQYCTISIANTLEMLQCCTKSSMNSILRGMCTSPYIRVSLLMHYDGDQPLCRHYYSM